MLLLKKMASFRRAMQTQPGEFRLDRARWVGYGVFSLFGVVAVRAILLALFPSQSQALQSIANHQYQREIELAPYRGGIYDHRGEAMAISVKRPSLAVNPRVFNPSGEEAQRLARITKVPLAHIKRLAGRKAYFAWLARQLDQHVADEAMNLGLDGMVQINEPARYYPAGSAAAALLGFMGLDNSGLAGLERQFDRELKGQPTRILAAKDAKGRFIFDEVAGAAPEKTGYQIHLTIDRVIQEIAEDELARGVAATGAKRGFAVVSDPHTGRILAVANVPTFDPNNARKVKIAETRNGALLDTFEPGSVVKPFIIATALEKHATTVGEAHDTENGALRVGKYTIHDDHKAKSMTTAEALIKSSNIGTFKIASKLGRDATFNALKSFGLGGGGERLGFPGEASGHLDDWRKWAAIRFANVAFGHGFVVTGLELVQAMGVIANGGYLMKPNIIEKIVSSDGQIVMSSPTEALRVVLKPETARTMRSLLKRVVTEGTGKQAQTVDYSTAGKTGTAQKVEPGTRGYAKGKYIASFVGFAPVDDPHLVVYVMIDEADQKHYYGAESAAPVFAKIAERSLRYLNVAADLSSGGTNATNLDVAIGPKTHAPRKL